MPVSIRASLLRSLAGLVLLVAVPIFAITSFSSQRSVRDISQRLIDQSSQEADRKLESFFSSIDITVEGASHWWKRNAFNYKGKDDLHKLNDIFVPVLDVVPEVTSMMLATDEGWEYLLFRDLRGGDTYEWYNRIVWVDRGPAAGQEAFWTKDLKLLRRGPLPKEAHDYDPRKRNFFTEPPLGKLHWTRPYYFGITKDAGITATLKWQDAKSGHTQVVAFDLLLRDLSRFTTQMRPSKNGRVFLMAQDGEILGLPANKRWQTEGQIRDALRNPNEKAVTDDHARLLSATDLNLPVEADAVGIWRTRDESNQGMFRFASGGQYWWGDFREVKARNLRLWVAVLVPENDFLAIAKHQRRLVLAVTLTALIIAVFLALWLARRYSKPLEQLAKHSANVRTLNLEDMPPVKSNVAEIQELAEAHAQMMSALGSFSRYVPINLVRELLRRNEVAKIGGRTETLTILFSDIVGFTSLAEQLQPAQVTEHLSEYFTALLKVIETQEGTVDKFIGDAIVAFWGAPVKDSEHALRAVRAALGCRKVLAQLNPKWEAAGKPQLRTRFGLATGEVLVGNVGSPERLNYTVLGDNVNVASRLEGLNKIYGTDILVTEAVVQATGTAFTWRLIDRLAVKGRREPIGVYEPLGATEEISAAQRTSAQSYEAALEQYTARKFSAAAEALKTLLADHPEDGPAARLRELCLEYAQTPPDADWDGVYRHQAK
jgi:adenylate cyclase